MKIKSLKTHIFLFLSIAASNPALSALPMSGEQRFSFDSVAVIGFDKANSAITGVYHFKNVEMPSRSFHADCKIFFSGKYRGSQMIPVNITAGTGKENTIVSGVLEFHQLPTLTAVAKNMQSYSLKINKNLPGCTDSLDITDSDFQFEIREEGTWKAVGIIDAKRSYFHHMAAPGDRGNAYVIKGDVIYIYDEDAAWYYVKYRNGKNETAGWIKKTDTLQINK